MDIDPELNPDYCPDVRDVESFRTIAQQHQIQGVLADPPYTKEFAANYSAGPDVFPSAIVKNALAIPASRRPRRHSLNGVAALWISLPRGIGSVIAKKIYAVAETP